MFAKKGESLDYIEMSSYKLALGGLISKLHADYFSDETDPFNAMSDTIINTTQNQNQSIKIEIAIEMTEFITNKMGQYKEGSVERSFLERAKQGMKEGKGLIELINLILKTGSKLGLTASAMSQLLLK